MRYPLVLFDVGHTLIGPRESFGAVYSRVLEALGHPMPPDALERGIRRTLGEMDRTIPAGADRYRHFEDGERGYWRRFAGRAIEMASDGPADAALVDRAVHELAAAFRDTAAWRVYDDTRPALEQLRKDGARLAVVSNWDSNLPELLDRLDLSRYFETLGVSHLEGVEKPDPAFFTRVLERLGAAPQQALHVGDSEVHDLGGARAAGIDAVLIDREGTPPHDRPAIRSLEQLPALARGVKS